MRQKGQPSLQSPRSPDATSKLGGGCPPGEGQVHGAHSSPASAGPLSALQTQPSSHQVRKATLRGGGSREEAGLQRGGDQALWPQSVEGEAGGCGVRGPGGSPGLWSHSRGWCPDP